MTTRLSIRAQQAQAIHQAGYEFAADAGRHQGAIPETLDVAPPAMTASEQTQLTVMVFPGTQTLPLFAAQAQGYFAEARSRRRSEARAELRGAAPGLAAGRYQIVHGAADQCVALVEAAKVDAMIVAGGDNGFNHLFVQPEIARIADLRGRHAGGRRRQHRLVVRALRNPQAARPLARRHHHP